ncbi:GNAT family N-acetyltransferase [Agreia pratensis]|uniref:Ribosomal protein S18 acetylase RimI n=1 Tax=Agreia pratensis TaxID=150121 RepID=A0A1X7L9D1_9MICO|nr:GNAT family N-acetyltransferase [Agreia pratensis]SMG50013.1 Ribosomal protein S18 acetylase RimI [Agreia pratensis]
MTTPSSSTTVVPPADQSVTVSRAEAHHVASAGRVLAAAFVDDPVMACILPQVPGPDRERRLRSLFEAMMLSGPLKHGTVDVATDATGDVLGVAVWESPRARSLTFLPLQLPRFVRALGLLGLMNGAVMLHALRTCRPGLPHWYLGEIGVSASARGRGVGSALLAHGLARADASGHPSYLESSTEKNRALYRRNGFLELGLIPKLRDAAPAAMMRPAKTKEPSVAS